MFTIEAEDKGARAGVLYTSHGKLKTPFYMPVATKGTAKDLTPEELRGCGIRSVISNGFLLSLIPGAERIAEQGGIHRFMHWKRGVFTDSGGFQILSDSFLVKKTEEGVIFRNPYTGQQKLYTPEMSVHNQHLIGSDVAMALDDVPPYGVSKTVARETMKRTHAWLERNSKAHAREDDRTNKRQMLFGIGQGGIYNDLRKLSAEQLLASNIDGLAIGGLAIGEPAAKMFHAIEIQTRVFQKMPEKARYVMGLGSPHDMVRAVGLGADMFDSIFPTQNARRGSLFTWQGTLRIDNSRFKDDAAPIEEECSCYTCKHYSRSYVHHMLKLKERMGLKLASIHNIHFIQSVLDRCREAICAGNFSSFQRSFLKEYNP
jgi:queuine tRNA-ribosyltransferase